MRARLVATRYARWLELSVALHRWTLMVMNSKSRARVTLLALTLGFAAFDAGAVVNAPFAGVWRNAASSQTIQAVKISSPRNDGTYGVRIVAVCSPRPCKWGTLSGVVAPDSPDLLRVDIPSMGEDQKLHAKRQLRLLLVSPSAMDFEFTTDFIDHPDVKNRVVRGQLERRESPRSDKKK